MPGASPAYTPRDPAVLLPLAAILPFLGACDFIPTSPLYGITNTLERRCPNVMERRQLLGLLGAKTSTTTSSTTATATATSTSRSIVANSSSSARPTSTSSATIAASSTSTVSSTSAAASASSSATCLSSGTESTINSLFSAGGAGTTVWLCPGVTFMLQNPIQFTAASQTLATKGLPTDSTRAILVVSGLYQSNAITSSCAACSGVAIRNLQVNGNRPLLGYINANAGGSALLEVGGSNTGQVVDNVRAYEPRSWSTVHAIEGTSNTCSGMIITNNQLGPAGNGPSGAQQNRLRRAAYTPIGQWADGLSLACQNTLVTLNTVTDATDGAIVVFGAPGSTVTANLIVANTRVAMGGVNMVDKNPYSGSFAGTTVTLNTFNANSSMIKVGIALGQMVWSSDNATADRTSLGVVAGNIFTSGASTGSTPGYFGYGIAVAGHNNATVTGNIFKSANFAGIASGSCTSALPPTPGPLYIDPTNTPGAIVQDAFVNATLSFLICVGPTTKMSQVGYSS